ncbi:hypothetical protein TNCV_3338971 [Trichonephila clavipes]|nr:hypothetical protein TNCV_3338971 [Trichonephila clavipes]
MVLKPPRPGATPHQPRVFSLNIGVEQQNCTVTYMVLKPKNHDRCKILALSHDEFRGPDVILSISEEKCKNDVKNSLLATEMAIISEGQNLGPQVP